MPLYLIVIGGLRLGLQGSALVDKCEQGFVYFVLPGCAHAVGSALEDLQPGVLDEFGRQKRRICDGHNLVKVGDTAKLG